jgi:hypothetical protein
MPDDSRELCCLVEGGHAVFRITAPNMSNMLYLRQIIWEQNKNGPFRHVDAADLMIFKVRSR